MEAQKLVLNPAAGTLTKVRLTGDKEVWRRSLTLVGIGEFTAFPDLDGLARELGSRYFT
jgi:hypothetical protein